VYLVPLFVRAGAGDIMTAQVKVIGQVGEPFTERDYVPAKKATREKLWP
jgi:hypothetical protein